LGLLNLCVIVTRGLRPGLLAFAALRLVAERGFFSAAFRPEGADVNSQGREPLDASHQFTT
jgi:hypothetical protein